MTFNFIELLINITLASLGGLVKRLTEAEKTPRKKHTLSYYIIGSLIAMFVGVVIYLICKNFNLSQFLTAGLTALSGYMGVPVLDLLSKLTKKRLEKEAGIEDDSEKPLDA